tara:strand:+ start:2360 stop:3133 length:774 start_codon:yes stop_codon:yes gene_type:complete
VVLSALKSLFSGSRPLDDGAKDTVFSTSLSPDQTFYAIGDIHGCDTLLTELLTRVESENEAGSPVVFLGDYVDRGPNSAAVLSRLHELSQEAPYPVICLMGNHEKMMLEFIDDPVGKGLRWLKHGGIETLESFGLTGVTVKSDMEDLMEVADELEAALPDGLQTWLRALPLQWRSGNIVCVHAAMDPAREPEDQSSRTLLWGHNDDSPRTDGLWVIHGHTIVKEPATRNGRIGIDTGAYQSGRLTAAEIKMGSCRFL